MRSEQVTTTLDDVPECLRVLGIGQLAREQLPEAENRVERCAQLVAHPGKELVLGLVRGLRRGDGIA